MCWSAELDYKFYSTAMSKAYIFGLKILFRENLMYHMLGWSKISRTKPYEYISSPTGYELSLLLVKIVNTF